MPSPRRSWRPLAVTASVAIAALVFTPLRPAPATAADDDDLGTQTVTIVTGAQPVGNTVQLSTGTLTISGQGDITNAVHLDSAAVADACVLLAKNVSSCIGSNDGAPITISGYSRNGVVSGTEPALQWIVDEAREFVHVAYDVPSDERITDYAQPQIRAYVAARILNIVDKAAYGKALTAQEQGTLTWLNRQIADVQTRIAQAAYDEWLDWEKWGCGYYPPPPPAWAKPGVGLPAAVFSYCHMHPGMTVYQLPPMPSVDDFRTWGVYRVAQQNGLQIPDSNAQALSIAATAAYLELGAMATTAVATYLVSTSAAAFATLAGAIGSVLPATSAGLSAVALTAQVGAAVTSVAGTAIIAVVIFAALSIAITAWQLSEQLQIGPTLAAALAAAKANTDPLGLKDLAVTDSGKDMATDIAANPPPYRTNGLEVRLLTMMSTNVGVGSDQTGVWDDSAHSSYDYRFSMGDRKFADQISVPKPDGTRSTVWFSKKWMIERTADGVEHAILSLEYVNADGKTDLARRSGNGFLITTLDPDKTKAPTTRTGPLSFLSASGQEQLVGLAPQSAPVLGGPRPTAVGALYPGRVVNLRPNPVDADGNFALDAFVDGYTYDWKVRYLDSDGWHDVALEKRAQGDNASYGARFVPSRPGQYQATVTMTSTTDPQAPPQMGHVDFTVASPALTLPILTLHDDGGSQVRVQVQGQLSTPLEGKLGVEVQWPGEITSDDPGPVTNATLICHNVDPFSCQTQDSDRSTEPGTALTHTLSTTARLRDGVTVTVRDLNGTAVVTQKLAFSTSARPTFAAPPAPTSGQAGTVQFNTYLSTLTVPVATSGADPNYAVATVVPGGTGVSSMSVIDPASGAPAPFGVDLFAGTSRAGKYLASVEKSGDTWLLVVHAVPGTDDLGATTVPVTIRQDDGKRATLFLTIDPVVAPGDRFRGSLITDKDPATLGVTTLPQLTPALTGGRTDWGAYTGRICLSADSSDGGGSRTLCGSVADIVGAGDQPFPYARLLPHGAAGTVTAKAWLPDASDEAWDAPMAVRFILLSGPPTITGLAWNGKSLRAAITPGQTLTSPTDVPVTAVSCTLDGAPVDSCFGLAGGRWTPEHLASGAHTLHVQVVDRAGNFDTEELAFDVAASGHEPTPTPTPTRTPTTPPTKAPTTPPTHQPTKAPTTSPTAHQPTTAPTTHDSTDSPTQQSGTGGSGVTTQSPEPGQQTQSPGPGATQSPSPGQQTQTPAPGHDGAAAAPSTEGEGTAGHEAGTDWASLFAVSGAILLVLLAAAGVLIAIARRRRQS